jgi:hypothetical protein
MDCMLNELQKLSLDTLTHVLATGKNLLMHQTLEVTGISAGDEGIF